MAKVTAIDKDLLIDFALVGFIIALAFYLCESRGYLFLPGWMSRLQESVLAMGARLRRCGLSAAERPEHSRGLTASFLEGAGSLEEAGSLEDVNPPSIVSAP